MQRRSLWEMVRNATVVFKIFFIYTINVLLSLYSLTLNWTKITFLSAGSNTEATLILISAPIFLYVLTPSICWLSHKIFGLCEQLMCQWKSSYFTEESTSKQSIH